MTLDNLVQRIPEDAVERVFRRKDRYDQRVCEVLRQETSLRLNRVGRDETTQVRIAGLRGLTEALPRKPLPPEYALVVLLEPWAVSADIDAVVPHAYGLTRDQYARVVSIFRHSSYKDAPRQCLAAFDELHQIDLEAFTKKHDQYWNIPLNENLPRWVIRLPIPTAAADEAPRFRTGELFDFPTTLAPADNGALVTERPVPTGKRNHKKH